MPGYVLAKTLSENGHVARGVCITENGSIKQIRELKQIMRIDGTVKYEDHGNWYEIDETSPVSMNFWGFTPAVFDYVEEGFTEFLKNSDTDLIKDEYYIPNVIDQGVKTGDFDCKVIHTSAKWMGVTYRSDKPDFEKFLNEKIASGEYPANLWSK